MPKAYLPPAPIGKKYVFQKWKYCPWTGQQLNAKTFGYSAWPILVDA